MNKQMNRRNELVRIIKEKNGATVKDLAEVFSVSVMTIRRDLEALEQSNLIINVHGAAIYNPSGNVSPLDSGYHLTSAKTSMEEAKTKIGVLAASLISNDDIILIDTGSTTEKLALAMDSSLKATVLCYNLNIMNILASKQNILPGQPSHTPKNLNLIFAGGFYHPNTQMVESPQGISLIKATRASRVFVSAAGIHQRLGITCANHYETLTKQAILNSAAQRILLADSSKFDQIKSSYFAAITDFDIIITDGGINSQWKQRIEALGIRLLLA